MAFMDQFRFGGQNDLLQMPSQGGFGMMQSPFGQPQQQYGFGMFQSPWQQNGYNPQPGNMGFNPQQPAPSFNQPQNPAFQQPQNPIQNPNIGHNNPLTPSFGGGNNPFFGRFPQAGNQNPPPGYNSGGNPGYHGPGAGVMGGPPTGPWAKYTKDNPYGG